jgi:pimeloyl-ACP methyl ester carboxylesterase
VRQVREVAQAHASNLVKTVKAATDRSDEIVPVRSHDGVACELIHVRGSRRPRRGPVVLVHGAGVRANIFRAPVRETLVDYLLRDGWDVWLENWRACIDFKPREWTLDEAAAYDHPRAVETILERTGADELRAVIHCQGSTSFAMAAAAGLLPRVSVIVSNAVSLHPVIPAWSHAKLRYAVGMLRALKQLYLDPSWGKKHVTGLPALIRAGVDIVHRECENDVCKLVSFTYGAGFPALWDHRLLNDATHDWLRDEFGWVPISFFDQITRSVNAGELIPTANAIPADYLAQPKTAARFALLAGARNHCFLPESQVRTHAYLRANTGRTDHTLHVLPQYGHLDVFMGQYAATDVFPLIARELAAA